MNANNVPFALIGGIAVAVRGEPRFTADIDAVLGIELDRALKLLESLKDSDFQALFSDAAEVVKRSFILPLKHRSTKIKVDLAIGLSGFERQLISRATLVDFGFLALPVATAEDLLLMKLLAGRPRDTDDAHRLVARQGKSLDWDYLINVGRELEEAVSQDLLTQLGSLQKLA
jgi:hypothetical protein